MVKELQPVSARCLAELGIVQAVIKSFSMNEFLVGSLKCPGILQYHGLFRHKGIRGVCRLFLLI